MSGAGHLPTRETSHSCEPSLTYLGYTAGVSKKAGKPKTKCCVSTTRCKRCPIRMLKEGTLPPGYTVKKRKLVKVDKKRAKKLAAAA